jgi:hypothetical protein
MRRIIAGQLARNSGWLIYLFAIAGLLTSVVILFGGGLSLPGNIVDRAQISGAIGGLFALIVAIVAISAAIWMNTSDFKAEQGVTSDTARVRAALRSILIKGVQLESAQREATTSTFKEEQKVINEFLTSTTAFGYWSWVDHRNIQAGHSSEAWRLFFFHFARLLGACQPPHDHDLLLSSAVAIEDLLATLSRRDVDTISSYVADLTGALGAASASSHWALAALAQRYAEKPNAIGKFRHLERKGVSSPNVELFIAVFTDDEERLKRAFAAGADDSLTEAEVLAAYQSQLADFDPDEW